MCVWLIFWTFFSRWSSGLTPGSVSEEHISMWQRPVHCTIHNSQVMLGCLVLRGKFRVPEKSSPGGDISETSASVAVETPGYWRWQEFTKGDGLCRVELAWCYKINCVRWEHWRSLSPKPLRFRSYVISEFQCQTLSSYTAGLWFWNLFLFSSEFVLGGLMSFARGSFYICWEDHMVSNTACICALLNSQVCICWSILDSLEWNLFDHGVLSFKKTFGFHLQVFC